MYIAMKKFRTVRVALLAGLMTIPGVRGDEIDPAAKSEIDRMRAAVAALDQYRMTIESLTDETLPSGQLVQIGRATEIKVSRPDRLAATVVRDSGERWSAWLDAGKLVLLDETGMQYSRVELPARIDEALEELADKYDLDLPLADVVSGLRRDNLLSHAESGLYVGTDTVAGRECHHVLVRQPVADWQAWVESGEPALPRRILMVYKDEAGAPGYQATITDWDTTPNFDDETWKPKLPPDAVEVPIDELLGKEPES